MYALFQDKELSKFESWKTVVTIQMDALVKDNIFLRSDIAICLCCSLVTGLHANQLPEYTFGSCQQCVNLSLKSTI